MRWIREQGSKLLVGNYLCSRAHDLSKPYLAIKNEAFKKLSVCDIKRPDAFIWKLTRHSDPVSEFLWKNLSGATQGMLQGYCKGPVPESLVEDLNKLLYQDGFYNEKRFAGVPLKTDTSLMQIKPREDLRSRSEETTKERYRRNKMLLEEAYSEEIIWRREVQPLDWRIYDIRSRATRVRPMAGIKQRMKDMIEAGRDPIEVIEEMLPEKGYELLANFYLAGTEKIQAELNAWVKQEAQRFPRARRGRAALSSKDYLRWLAAYRLNEAGRRAGLTVEDILSELTKRNISLYADERSWSRAKRKALNLLKLLESNPREFEKKILL